MDMDFGENPVLCSPVGTFYRCICCNTLYQKKNATLEAKNHVDARRWLFSSGLPYTSWKHLVGWCLCGTCHLRAYQKHVLEIQKHPNKNTESRKSTYGYLIGQIEKHDRFAIIFLFQHPEQPLFFDEGIKISLFIGNIHSRLIVSR